ncbi:MAG: phosphoribosyltransferase family protein [Flavobacteriales bacterium]|nr:phosphoribosyltransferase family protein [Flavobacteriales bacterium]
MCCKNSLHKGENHFCISCEANFSENLEPLNNKSNIAQLFWGKADVTFSGAPFNFLKQENLQQIIHEFKYGGNSNLAKYMGSYLGLKIKDVSELADVDCVSFVPMHPKKIKKRGYNQAEELATGVAKKLNVQTKCVLKRLVESASQTEKGVYERYENMDANFTALHGFEGKHILLVDDVLTTGATLIACVNAIKKKYDVKVSIVCLAFRAVER